MEFIGDNLLGGSYDCTVKVFFIGGGSKMETIEIHDEIIDDVVGDIYHMIHKDSEILAFEIISIIRKK